MAVRINLTRRTVTLSVGDLVAESLSSVGRVAGLSMWARMEMGREAHTVHQQSQAELHSGYSREVAIKHEAEVDGFAVTVQGRIDGVIPPSGNGPTVVEEVKSVVLPPLMFGALHRDSYPHYVEQLRLYCFFLGGNVAGRLVFVNVADGSRKEVEIAGPFTDCAEVIAVRVRVLIDRASEEQQRKEERRRAAQSLPFPHPQPRRYQDEMLAAVSRALVAGRHLLVSAPSGIGKTAGALHPVMTYALANDKRVFFVTAKNTQHAQALETLRRMGGAATSPAPGSSASGPVAVAFRAREKMCINSVYACREEFCPHLQMFALKLERTQIRERLREQRVLDADALIAAGQGTSLCPFELALLEAEQADVVVCDYNYVFDPQVYFRRFFQERDYSDTILIIDEAHNLVQRAQGYYSPRLTRQQIRDVLPHLRMVETSLAKAFRRTLTRMEEFFRSMERQSGDEYSQLPDRAMEGEAPDEPQSALSLGSRGRSPSNDTKVLIESPRAFFEELKPELNRLAVRYLLDKLTRGTAVPDDPIDAFLADFGQFCSVLALEGEEFAYVYDGGRDEAVQIVCLDASRQLRKRMEGFHSVIAMSATLEPLDFHESMLGFDPERTDAVRFPSPFPRENRRIAIVPNVQTTYRQRARNYERVAETIRVTIGVHRGHYMALFPSYEFLRSVAEKLTPEATPADYASLVRETRPGFRYELAQPPGDSWCEANRVLIQRPTMSEDERRSLLDSLAEADPPKLILAVQGGVFAEGVDYPGELLSGVIVVSPALPQVSFERELMRGYFERIYGKGFEYAYLYPGMNRVIQSVGRLIRTETDRGVAVLVCQRFSQQQYRGLFPAEWNEDAKQLVTNDLAAGLEEFWETALHGRQRH